MADFLQNGVITTLHKLKQRDLGELEAELSEYGARQPMALILPSLFSEIEGPALPRIVEQLAEIPYLSEIIIGLDQADHTQFKHARAFFDVLPQRKRILWHDGPRLRLLDEMLRDQDLAPQQAGKGRNAWYCLGYVLAAGRADIVGLHDCDIVTYDRQLPARLFYPLANPNFDFLFCKGYYARVGDDRLGGRVTRLFYTPLLRALEKVVGRLHFLDYLDSFRYSLSGEFSLRKQVINTIRIPSDWGLEVGVLSELYRNYNCKQICQVDIADNYDHKHQGLSDTDPEAGLAKMSTDIAKSIYRKLATEGITFSNELFRTIKATYYRTALDFVEQYYYDARINGLHYDRHEEEVAVEVFVQSIIRAGEQFLANPMKAPFIPNWNRVTSAIPEFGKLLCEAVEEDNEA